MPMFSLMSNFLTIGVKLKEFNCIVQVNHQPKYWNKKMILSQQPRTNLRIKDKKEKPQLEMKNMILIIEKL